MYIYDFNCPTCGAPAGYYCNNAAGEAQKKSHKARGSAPRANAKMPRKGGRPALTAPRAAAEMRTEQVEVLVDALAEREVDVNSWDDVAEEPPPWGDLYRDAVLSAAQHRNLRVAVLARIVDDSMLDRHDKKSLHAIWYDLWAAPDIAQTVERMRRDDYIALGMLLATFRLNLKFALSEDAVYDEPGPRDMLRLFLANRDLILAAYFAGCLDEVVYAIQLHAGINFQLRTSTEVCVIPFKKLGQMVRQPELAAQFAGFVDKSWVRYIDNMRHRQAVDPRQDVRPSARIAWYMAFKDVQELPCTPGLTLWDTSFLSFAEYRKMRRVLLDLVDHRGDRDQSHILMAGVRLLRLFGTCARVDQYIRAWPQARVSTTAEYAGITSRTRPHDAMDFDYVHDAGQFELPRSDRWKPKAWADLALKFGPSVMEFSALFDVIEHEHGVPKTLNTLKKLRSKYAGSFLTKFGYDDNDRDDLLFIAKSGESVSAPLPDNLVLGVCKLGTRVCELSVLPRGDVRGLILGHLTSCCQSYGGAGHSCAVHGATSPDGGFVVVTWQDTDQIVAMSWYWRNGNAFVFDSIEIERDHRYLDGFADVVDDLYRQAAETLHEKFGYRIVNVGTGGAYYPQGATSAKKPVKPSDYDGYRDSHEQVSLFNADSSRDTRSA